MPFANLYIGVYSSEKDSIHKLNELAIGIRNEIRKKKENENPKNAPIVQLIDIDAIHPPTISDIAAASYREDCKVLLEFIKKKILDGPINIITFRDIEYDSFKASEVYHQNRMGLLRDTLKMSLKGYQDDLLPRKLSDEIYLGNYLDNVFVYSTSFEDYNIKELIKYMHIVGDI